MTDTERRPPTAARLVRFWITELHERARLALGLDVECWMCGTVTTRARVGEHKAWHARMTLQHLWAGTWWG